MEDIEKEIFMDILREHKKKITPQRLAVYNVIQSRKDHPNAEELHEEVKKLHPSISLSTIYQVLDLLQELGLISKIKSVERDSRYETDISPHLNAICPKCGAIQDYHTDSISEFWNKIKKEFNFEPLSKRIDAYRVCEKCRKK